MVGVPGKSKGCHTCRRRKIKCDLGQPNCGQCRKSARSCEGYQRALVFLNRTATGLQKRQPLEEAQPRQEIHHQKVTIHENNSGPPFPVEISSEIMLHSQRMPRQVNDSVVKMKEYETLFLEEYLPSDRNLRGNTLGLWLLESVCISDADPVLQSANQSLFLSRFGRMCNDKSVTFQGKLRYRQALRQLQRAVSDESLAKKDETLAACQALTLYEVLESTESAVKGQKTHLSGIVKLLKHRKPYCSQSKLSDALMEYFRYPSMVLCIQQRSLSLFGGLEAKQILWPFASTVEQKLYNMGFTFATILEDIDKNIEPELPLQTKSRVGTFISRCRTLDQEFATWYQDLAERNGNPESANTWREFLFRLDYKSQAEIHFPDLRLAHLLLCFWTLRTGLMLTLLLLLKCHPEEEAWRSSPTQAIQDAELRWTSKRPHSQFTPGSTSECPSSLSHCSTAVVQLTGLIIRAIPYCIGDGMGVASCIRCVFGLRTALGVCRVIPQQADKLPFCHEIVTQLTEKRGICFAEDIARFSGKWGDTKEAYPK